MVLVRRLSQVRHLEDALVRAGLRFTVEGGKSFFDRQEVHEALAVLKAIDDPSDRLSLVAALRSSFLGVSDRDIVAYALAGRRPRARQRRWPRRSPGPRPWARALELLGRYHERRTRLSVAALLEALYDETRVLAAFTLTRRGESAIANLQKVVALARQSQGLGVLTLRGFTRLLEERTQTAREEPDLPTTRAGDPDTIRILTVHKAKGLEAPVVALFDTADNASAAIDVITLFEEGRIALGFRKGCRPPQWDELEKRELKKAAAENKRLLYVAATRAARPAHHPAPAGVGAARQLLARPLVGPARAGRRGRAGGGRHRPGRGRPRGLARQPPPAGAVRRRRRGGGEVGE